MENLDTVSKRQLLPLGTYESCVDLSKAKKDADNEKSFTLAKVEPLDIRPKTMEIDIFLTGFTLNDFSELHTGAQFSFAKLEELFTDIMPDYGTAPVEGVGSLSLHFCSVVTFVVGPGSRNAKKAGREGKWRMVFLGPNNVYYSVIVATFKTAAPKNAQPVLEGSTLVLTVKQASLLAVKKLNSLVDFYAGVDKFLFTPLAGSVFCKDDVEEMAEELKMTEGQLIKSINASCQGGGFYLEESNAALAAIASIVATRNADEKLANSIITKTVKQYGNHHKDLDLDLFDICAKYATGGVPKGCSAKELIERMKKATALSSVRDYTRLGGAKTTLKTGKKRDDNNPPPGPSGIASKPADAPVSGN